MRVRRALPLALTVALFGCGAELHRDTSEHPDDTAPAETGDCNVTTWYPDEDGDGYGADAAALDACAQPAGTLSVGGDCADDDVAIHPFGRDECNDGVDQNCDGSDRPCGEYQLADAQLTLEGPGLITLPVGLSSWGTDPPRLVDVSWEGTVRGLDFGRTSLERERSSWAPSGADPWQMAARLEGDTPLIAAAVGEGDPGDVYLLASGEEGDHAFETAERAWNLSETVHGLTMAADIREDGGDLIFASTGSDSIGIRLEDESGEAPAWSTLPVADLTPVADVDGDGFPDLVARVPWYYEAGSSWGFDHVLIPGPLGAGVIDPDDAGVSTWSEAGSTTNGGSGYRALPSVGDLDGDGRAELAFAGRNWYHDGGGTPAGVHILSADSADGRVDEVATAVIARGDVATGLGDRDGDGRDDLLVEVTETAWVTSGPLAGLVDETSLVGNLHFGLNCYDCTFWADAGDMDGDGEQDLVFLAEVYDPPGSAQSTSSYFAFYGPFG